MKIIRIVLLTHLAALACAALPALPVLAAPAGSLQIGSVDLQKVSDGYTKKGSLDQQLQDMNQRLLARFQQQTNSAMLSKDQQTRLQTLLAKPGPSDAEKAEIAALQAQSTKDSQELATLQQKKDLTDADKARLTALTQQQQGGQQVLQEVSDSYTKQLDAEKLRLNAQLTEAVRAAIIAVAKDRKLDAVFTSEVAIFTTNDITDDVLKRLNK